jgi:hypothetical protein
MGSSHSSLKSFSSRVLVSSLHHLINKPRMTCASSYGCKTARRHSPQRVRVPPVEMRLPCPIHRHAAVTVTSTWQLTRVAVAAEAAAVATPPGTYNGAKDGWRAAKAAKSGGESRY